MDAAVHHADDDIEKILNIGVEKYFNVDIDTIFKSTSIDQHVFVRSAEEKYRKLLARVYAGKNKWRPGAWSIIVSSLMDEREYIYDLGDTTAVCTYALYIEAAFLYLRRRPAREQLDNLITIVREDVRRVGAYILSEHASDVSEHEKKMIVFAMTMAGLYIARLQREYPDIR